MDYFSFLPKDIIHTHIFPRLFIKEAAKTSFLSKRWKSLWSSYPNLYFYQYQFHTPLSFRNFVDQTIRDPSRTETDLLIFKLSITHGIHVSDINNWVRLVMSRNVKGFHFLILGRDPYQWPSRNSCMANTLTILKLSSVRFTSINNTITLPHLHTLSFDNVCIDQETIEKFFSACPSMNDLKVWSCHELKSLNVAKNPRLKRVCIGNCIMLQNLGITHVPCLESLTLCLNKSFETLSKRGFVLDSRAYDTLKELHLSNYSNQEYAFQVLLSALTNLECLVLQRVMQRSQFINISSMKLKRLVLNHCDFLVLSITAPNLTSFKYENSRMLLYPLDACNVKDYTFSHCRSYSIVPFFKNLKFQRMKQFLMNSSNGLLEGSKMIIDLKWCNYTVILEDSESITKLPCDVIDGLLPTPICFSNMSFSRMVEWFLNQKSQFSQNLLIISSADESKFCKVLKAKRPNYYSESLSFIMNRETFEMNTGLSVNSIKIINKDNDDRIEFLDALLEVGFNTKEVSKLEH